MRALFVLLSCAACNSLLGLDKTTEVPTLDAPPVIDAAHYVCDPLPMFIVGPQILLPGCTDYTTDAHHDQIAIASCEGGGGNGSVIHQSAPGAAMMTPVSFNNDATTKEVPRLGPAGDTMIVRSPVIPVPGTASFRIFVQGSDGSWVEDQSQAIVFENAFTVSMMDTISTPTAGAIDRHVVIHHFDSIGINPETFVEFAESRFNGWKLQHTYAPADLDVTTFSDPYLSDDGLALWFVGTDAPGGPPAIFASIRSGGGVFPPATKITFPLEATLHNPFVTRDCSRLYFGVGSETSFVVH